MRQNFKKETAVEIVAIFNNQAGEMKNNSFKMIFDNDLSTYWSSSNEDTDNEKKIEFIFHVRNKKINSF